MTYLSLLGTSAMDAIAIATLAYGVYYRRYRRAELSLAFVSLNIGVFAAVTLLAAQPIGVSLGFGLFGVLSIVRLRSSAISHSEVGYYFTALVLGLVNGLGWTHLPIMISLDVLLIAVPFALDRYRIEPVVQPYRVVLEVVHTDPGLLRADLERRFGGTISAVDVVEIDYVREVTVCDVKVRRDANRDARVAAVLR